MIINTECPRCNGTGEALGSTPSVRSRYVRYDDLDPGDFGEPCPNCGGSGSVEYDDEEVAFGPGDHVRFAADRPHAYRGGVEGFEAVNVIVTPG